MESKDSFESSDHRRVKATARVRFVRKQQRALLLMVSAAVAAAAVVLIASPVKAFLPANSKQQLGRTTSVAGISSLRASAESPESSSSETGKRKVVIVGAGWGGLSVAHSLSSQTKTPLDITVVDASPKVGGLVRDGFQTLNGKIDKAEAGQHGFWDNYHNIFISSWIPVFQTSTPTRF